LADCHLPGYSWKEALAQARERCPNVPTIMVTGSLGEEVAVETIKNGAVDYVLKDRLSRLAPAAMRAVRESEEREQRRRAETMLEIRYHQLRLQNEAVHQSEERFRQLTEYIREVFWMTDVAKNQMLYVSPGYEEVWGRTCESLHASPRNWLEAIHPDDRERVVQAALTKQISGHYNEEYRILRPDGSLRWIQDRAYPVRDEAGKVYRIAGIAEDITERKLAEQRLAAEHAVLRALAESASLREAAVRILQPVCQCLGWELGMLWEVDRQNQVLRCVDFWAATARDGEPLLMESRARTFSKGEAFPGLVWEAGKGLWIADVMADPKMVRGPLAAQSGLRGAFGFPILSGDEIMGVIEFFSREIREPDTALLEMMSALGWQIGQFAAHKRAEAQLTTLARAVETTSEAICITDMQDRFTFVNRAFQDIYGYTETEILGKTPELLFAPSASPLLLAQILEQSRLGGWRGEVMDRRKDGSEFPVSLSTSQIKDRAGQVVGLMGVAQDITERKRAEEQIRLLADAVQSIQEMVTIKDRQNRLVFVNRAFVKTCGYTETEVLGRTPEFLYSANNSPGLCQEVYEQTLRGGWTGEMLNRRKDGSDFPISLSTAPIKDGDGRVLNLIGVARDVTERKRVEAELKDSEEKFRTLFEAAPIAAALQSADGTYLQVNAAYERMVGYTDKELQNLGNEHITHPGDHGESRRLVGELRAGLREGYTREKRYWAKGGRLVWAHTAVSAVRDEAGGLRYIVSMVEDITQRKRVEAALRELAAIVENSQDAIVSATLNGAIVSWNKAAERLFGYSAQEAIGMAVSELAPQGRSNEAVDVLRELALGKTSHSYETLRRRKDGVMIEVSLSVSPVKDAEGNVIGASAIARDITERKRLEKELLEISASERRHIGHELHDGLGQYLAGIAFRAKALQQSLDAEGHAQAAEAQELATLVSNAISQARSLARGLDPIEVETIGLLAALENLSAEVEKYFRVTCFFRCAEAAVPVNPRSALALYRITQEAIHNALTHGEAKQVVIELGMQNGDLWLAIQDNGKGFRVDTRQEAGMGLRVMEYRARSIGAKLEILSQLEQGTEVRCLLPRSVSQQGPVAGGE
jgi:PAS domain S-box-containing protein